jgi:hypothetical protein
MPLKKRKLLISSLRFFVLLHAIKKAQITYKFFAQFFHSQRDQFLGLASIY